MSSLSIDRNIQKAKSLAKKGQIDEAYQLYSAVLKKNPGNKRAQDGLDRLQQAGPGNDLINKLGTLYNQGQFQQALKLGVELNQRFPTSFLILNILGLVCSSLARLEDAVTCFNKTLQLKPDYFEAHNNLGTALGLLGRNEEALVCYSMALQLKPDYADARNNLGNIFMSLGKTEDSIACFTKALQFNPNDAQAHNSLGAAFSELGQNEKAIACFTKALEFVPDFTLARNNLLDEYEKANKLSEYKDVLDNIKAILPDDDPDLLYLQGKLASRENRLEDARMYLERAPSNKLSSELQFNHAELLGKTYDKLGIHDKAFAQYELMNSKISQSVPAGKFDPQCIFNNVLQLSDSWSAAPSPAWLPEVTSSNDSCALAFLVGFPRSGTTLLDTILMSHPKIAVVEEIPMVPRMMEHLNDIDTYKSTVNLDNAQIAQLREVYNEELNKHLDKTDYSLVIDKLPLNISHVGLIHRVFPEAKFILSLRHPCDCTLSCFMQNFKLNNAMANFLDLGQAAKYYDAIMRLWKIYNEHLELQVSVLKYEELVLDLKGSAEPLLNFLGLEWHENMGNYQKTALSRGRINTPSYNQVTQGIYTQASGRWENYHKQMEPVLPLLEPWARNFGY